MKYLTKSFTVHPGESKEYRDNWDRIFAKKPVATMVSCDVWCTIDQQCKLPAGHSGEHSAV